MNLVFCLRNGSHAAAVNIDPGTATAIVVAIINQTNSDLHIPTVDGSVATFNCRAVESVEVTGL